MAARRPPAPAGRRWTNAHFDPLTGETGAEQRGRARLALLVAAGRAVKYERAPSYKLHGAHGGEIGRYTPDDLLTLPDGAIIAVEWKGRISRDFPLRAALFRDEYIAPKRKRGAIIRLDVVPMLNREQVATLGRGAYEMIESYDPEQWPQQEAQLHQQKRAASAQKRALTKAINAAEGQTSDKRRRQKNANRGERTHLL